VLFETTTTGVREARVKRLHTARRPVSLLSGLLSCGCRGGKYGLILRDRFGCLNHHRRGTCNNNRTIVRARIEERVLSGLKDRLVSAASVAEAVRAYWPLRLKDVAKVEIGPDERRGITELNGEGEVASGILLQRFGANALTRDRNVKQRLSDIAGASPRA
jgi:hypothetical protein